MTPASELAALRALARRLDEPWPAEERVAQFSLSGHPARFPHSVNGRDGYWQHRRRWYDADGGEWRGSQWRPGTDHRFDAVQRPLPLNTAHAAIDDAGRVSLGGVMRARPSGSPADRARRGYRFRYADGRVEWRADVDPDRADWRLVDAPPGPDVPGHPRTFRRVVFAERGRPDIIEYHEDVPSAAGRLEAAALADLDANAFELAEARRSAERREARARASRAERQRLRVAGELVTYPCTWMPSIAGVGPIALRWPAETVTPDPEAWRTYEAIRACMSRDSDGMYVNVDVERWLSRAEPGARSEALAACDAIHALLGAAFGLDVFARAVADRLAPQPQRLPAAVKRLGALPRDWQWRRDARRIKTATDAALFHRRPQRQSNRPTLGTLAARYAPRRPDGSYNRHDARRWMRRFRAAALIASDALETHGTAGREVAITVLRQLVSEEDARKLTERPDPRAAGLAREMAEYQSPPPDEPAAFTSSMPGRIAPNARVARWTSGAGAGELATMEFSFRDDLRPQPREVTYERYDLALDLAPRQIVRHEIAGEVFDAVVVGLERRHGADGQPRTRVTLREIVRAPARSQAAWAGFDSQYNQNPAPLVRAAEVQASRFGGEQYEANVDFTRQSQSGWFLDRDVGMPHPTWDAPPDEGEQLRRSGHVDDDARLARSQAGGQRAPAWATALGEDLDEEAARLDMARFSGETDERFRRRIAEETGHGDRRAAIHQAMASGPVVT